MKRLIFLLPVFALLTVISCGTRDEAVSDISRDVRDRVVDKIAGQAPGTDMSLLRMGVNQAADLWRAGDGTPEEFEALMVENFAADSISKRTMFDRLSKALELFNGSFNNISIEIQKPLVLDQGEIYPIDEILASYGPWSHFTDDMFENKTAFVTILNFPYRTLEEKNTLGSGWSRLEWAYARMGDTFTSRVPAEVQAKMTQAGMASENYIASYNIKMDHLLTEDGRRLFPEGMSLLSHWNLRDELKSNYADVPDAGEKQEMIYRVMQRIILQEIPQVVINSTEYDWKPCSNIVLSGGKEIDASREPDTRYERILQQFHAYLEDDRYHPAAPDAIQRSFDGGMEMSSEETETLFKTLLSSPEVARVASVIKARLGRELRPYDIWYDGFKARSSMPEDLLTARTKVLYPDCDAFDADMPRLLGNMGFSPEDAGHIASHIDIQPARGSGHASPCISRTEPALLRTRVGADGMDYKGYNISVHEFGHNVEQVLSLYDMDHYVLYGIPNTAFTEAMAFLFQCRDLQLLGYGRQSVDSDFVLDHFWGAYEIMGVSLVDMYMWRWLYDHKDATAAQLREQTVSIARAVWNEYYEPVLGEHDSPILAIYSHIVNSPMYLPNYPLGHLIHFQLEQHLKDFPDPHDFAAELKRIYTLGRLTPDEWMRRAIGTGISVQPMLEAVDEICR